VRVERKLGDSRDRVIAVKAYGWDWSSIYGLSMVEAAKKMRSHGVDWMLGQNQIDPLPTSAVAQRPPARGYDDREWTARLQDEGLRVFQTTSMFFQPDEFLSHDDLRPVDQFGNVFERIDWYVGICPTSPEYFERKSRSVLEAIDRTQPDGVFLSFFRFPGFWELWLPESPGFAGTRRSDMLEYCFCERCLALFQQQTGHALAAGSIAQRAAVVLTELRDEWTGWKCSVIADVALMMRTKILELRPGTEIMLNAFGLGSSDFGNAVEEVLGQRISDLDSAIDYYELMFYFQIQKRNPYLWIPERVAEVRKQTTKPILADLQAAAEYLEPAFVSGERKRSMSAGEWTRALKGVERSGADGLIVYSWRDLLADEAVGGSRVSSLKDYKNGSLGPL
jgi:hypothetical protein